MLETVRKFLVERPVFFRVCFVISFVVALLLFVGGFFVPPMGQIDGSVLKAAGILMGFAVVAMLPDIIASGKTATIQHGQTRVTIGETPSEPMPEDDEDGNDQ